MRQSVRRIDPRTLSAILVCVLLATLCSGSLWCAAKALDQRQIEGLVRGGVANQRIVRFVKARGIDFNPTPAFLRLLKNEGAQKLLLDTLSTASHPPPPDVHPRSLAEADPPLSPEAVRYAEQYAEAQRHFEQGRQFFQQQQWPEVELQMRQAVETDPANLEAHFDLGYALSQQGKLPGAITEYRRVVQLDPDAGAVHYDLGVALEKEHDLGGAIGEYQQAVRLEPNDERAAYALGVALYQTRDWPRAAAEFEAALRLEPTDPDAYCALGLAQLHQHRVGDAVSELHEALRLNPQNALAHAGLAGALLRQGYRRAALKEFRVATALNPANSGFRADFQQLWRELYPPSPRRSVSP